MRRYVGGFQTFDESPGPARATSGVQPTAAERRERTEADRQASLTLVVVAVGVTALILARCSSASVVFSADRGGALKQTPVQWPRSVVGRIRIGTEYACANASGGHPDATDTVRILVE